MSADETGFEGHLNPAIEKILRPKIADKIDREYVRSTIESPGWKVFWDLVLHPQLDDWKSELLTRADLPEGDRKGIIMARLTLLEGIFTLYTKTGAHVPEWLDIELKEIGIDAARRR